TLVCCLFIPISNLLYANITLITCLFLIFGHSSCTPRPCFGSCASLCLSGSTSRFLHFYPIENTRLCFPSWVFFQFICSDILSIIFWEHSLPTPHYMKMISQRSSTLAPMGGCVFFYSALMYSP